MDHAVRVLVPRPRRARRCRARRLGAIAALLVTPLSAAGQSPPEQLLQSTYDRTGGPTNVYQSPVSTCDPTPSYRLVLENGVDGTRLVSNGSVLLNGAKVLDLQKGASRIEKAVSLKPANQLEVRLGGSRGGRVRVTVDGYPRCLGVRFLAPLPGSTLSQPETFVEGEVEAPGPAGVRLRVSYPQGAAAPTEVFVPLAVSGGRFAAWVPLAPGTLQLTALAADQPGRSGETSLSVTVTPASPDDDHASHPEVSPTVGFAPLTVTVGCHGAADPEVDVADVDVDGDGQADFGLTDCATPPHQVTHTYLTEGLHVTTLTLRDRSGRSYTRRVPVNVVPAPDLGPVWDGFRGALGRGDLDATLWFIALESRDRYRRVFEDLTGDLPALAAGLQGLSPLVVRPEYATASTTRVLDGVSELFLVSFVRDADGVWRIASF